MRSRKLALLLVDEASASAAMLDELRSNGYSNSAAEYVSPMPILLLSGGTSVSSFVMVMRVEDDMAMLAASAVTNLDIEATGMAVELLCSR